MLSEHRSQHRHPSLLPSFSRRREQQESIRAKLAHKRHFMGFKGTPWSWQSAQAAL